jgi:hypothetical protein
MLACLVCISPSESNSQYVAAFAPDSGESALSLLGSLKTPSPITPFLVFDTANQFVTISPQGVAEGFAQDLSKHEQVLLTATQGPASVAVLSATPTVTPTCGSFAAGCSALLDLRLPRNSQTS